MADIHPTALIDDIAQIADDAYVGPHCVIRGRVAIGPGGQLHGSCYLHGPLVIGRNVRIYPFACIGFAPQHRKFNPGMEGAGIVIGDDNVFREGATIHRAFTDKPTAIGDRNYFMGNSHIGHDAIIGNDCTFTQGAIIGGHVEIGDHVTVGGNAGVHQFVRLGRLSMVAGVVGVPQDVPPFCVYHHTNRISGLNLVGLRRAGYREHLRAVQRAFDILFRSGLPNDAAVKRIEQELGDDPLCMEIARFVPSTKRGIGRTSAITTDERDQSES